MTISYVDAEWIAFRDKFLRPLFTSEQYQALEWIFRLSWQTHENEERIDGEPYMTHIMAIINKLDRLGIHHPLILMEALGHDVFENSGELMQRENEKYSEFSDRTRRFICEHAGPRIGPKLADRLIVLTKPKIDGIEIRTEADRMDVYIENLYSAPADTILVKMVDRWHNMQTLGALSEDKQYEQCVETGAYMLTLFEEIADVYPSAYSRLDREIKRSLSRFDPEWFGDTNYYLRVNEIRQKKALPSAEILK